ncbi:MAG: ATP-binding protein [Candidatus Micrarchaeota archaeon]
MAPMIMGLIWDELDYKIWRTLLPPTAKAVRKALHEQSSVSEVEWVGDMVRPDRLTARYTLALDPTLLDYALFNIASNAVKYADRKLQVGALIGPEGAKIWISDDGQGMTEAEASNAFTKGVRNENATANSTGFGLFFSQEIIEQLGGRIFISDPGPRGGGGMTTFVVLLPTIR